MKKNLEQFDIENITTFLRGAVNDLHTNSDIDRLTAIKKLFKKTVPFYLRNYVASYMLDKLSGNATVTQSSGYSQRARNQRTGHTHDKDASTQKSFNQHDSQSQKNYHEGRNSGTAKSQKVVEIVKTFPPKDTSSQKQNSFKQDNFSKGDAPSARTSQPSHQDEKQFHPAKIDNPSTVFINIGKNRHVYQRDILNLLSKVASIENTKVGSIRIFSTYTFVDLAQDDAEIAIKMLNGYQHRNRPLTVSHAKQNNFSSEKFVQKKDVPAAAVQSAPIQGGSETDTVQTQDAAPSPNSNSAKSDLPEEKVLFKEVPPSQPPQQETAAPQAEPANPPAQDADAPSA